MQRRPNYGRLFLFLVGEYYEFHESFVLFVSFAVYILEIRGQNLHRKYKLCNFACAKIL